MHSLLAFSDWMFHRDWALSQRSACNWTLSICYSHSPTLLQTQQTPLNTPCAVMWNHLFGIKPFLLTSGDVSGLSEQVIGRCRCQKKQTGPISICCWLLSPDVGNSCMSTIGSWRLSWVWKKKWDWCQLPSWIWNVIEGVELPVLHQWPSWLCHTNLHRQQSWTKYNPQMYV